MLAAVLIWFFFFQKISSSLFNYLFLATENSVLLRILHCQMLSAKLHDVLPVLRNLLAEWTHACCRWSERVHTPDLRRVFVGFFAEREFCFGAGSVNLIPWLLREVLVRVRMLTVCRFTGGVRHGSFFFFFLSLNSSRDGENRWFRAANTALKGFPGWPDCSSPLLHHESHSGEALDLPD